MQSLEFPGLEPLFVRGGHRAELQEHEQAEARPTEAAQTEEEGGRLLSLEVLAEMPLESLLYYVLVGEGRTKKESAVG